MSSVSEPNAGFAEGEGLWPKHHRVYLVLRQQILEGAYGPATPMPSETTLAEQFGVSRITIRKAMERLAQEGSVDRERGRGTFARPAKTSSPVAASLSGNIENLIALGLKTEVRVIEFDYSPAPPAVSEVMDCPTGITMQRAVRVRSLDGQPFSHLTTWLPEQVGRSFDRAALEATPILKLIEAAGHHIRSARQTISACLAPPDVARLLEIEPGSALLSVRRVVFNDQGTAVEWIRGLYRPDTYEHETEFERDRGAAEEIWNT